jgi:hypothetical protein
MVWPVNRNVRYNPNRTRGAGLAAGPWHYVGVDATLEDAFVKIVITLRWRAVILLQISPRSADCDQAARVGEAVIPLEAT